MAAISKAMSDVSSAVIGPSDHISEVDELTYCLLLDKDPNEVAQRLERYAVQEVTETIKAK